MNKRLFLLTILLGGILINGCKNPEIQSRWTDHIVTVDGNTADWVQDTIRQYEDIQTALGLMNDANYLYIIFKFKSPFLAKRIRSTGFTLWFDNTGHKKKELGIRYGAENQKIQLIDSFWEILTPEQKIKLKQQQAERQDIITLINKDNLKQNKLERWEVASGYQLDVFCVEIKLPLKETFHTSDFVLKNKFNLGIEYGTFRNERKMMPPMGFMGGPDMMMGGRMGKPDSLRMRPFGENEIWLKVTLVQKNIS